MNEAAKVIDSRVAIVSLDSEDIITIRLKDCGQVEELDIINLNLSIRHFCAGIPKLKMVVTTSDWEMDKFAKKRAESEDRSTNTIARAIVVSGKLKAAIYNYMVGFNSKSPFPSQFFYNEQDAYQWLLSFKNLK